MTTLVIWYDMLGIIRHNKARRGGKYASILNLFYVHFYDHKFDKKPASAFIFVNSKEKNKPQLF